MAIAAVNRNSILFMLSFLGFAKIRKRELIKSEQGGVEIPLLFQHMIS